MSITVKVGIIFAFCWIAFKMILFYTLSGEGRFNVQPATLVNILFLLLAVSVGLFLQKRNDTGESNALNDIKNGLSSGLPYALIVSVFIYFYYAKIDPEFIQHKLAEAEVQIDEQLQNPELLSELKESNADFEVMTTAEIRATLLENQQAVFSPGSTMTVAMLGMLILATINSIFITVVYRKVIFR